MITPQKQEVSFSSVFMVFTRLDVVLPAPDAEIYPQVGRMPRPRACEAWDLRRDLTLHDFQLVIDCENSRNAVSPYSGNVLIHLVVDNAHQRHAAVRNNNPNRLQRA